MFILFLGGAGRTIVVVARSHIQKKVRQLKVARGSGQMNSALGFIKTGVMKFKDTITIDGRLLAS